MLDLMWHTTKYQVCLCQQWPYEVPVMQDSKFKMQIGIITTNSNGDLQKDALHNLQHHDSSNMNPEVIITFLQVTPTNK